jgi:hypothetical protein
MHATIDLDRGTCGERKIVGGHRRNRARHSQGRVNLSAEGLAEANSVA